jgi:hypothetical protein
MLGYLTRSVSNPLTLTSMPLLERRLSRADFNQHLLAQAAKG